MTKTIIALLIAAAGIFFWFQPLYSYGPLVQTGLQLPLLAYSLLILPVLFAALTWKKKPYLALLTAIGYVAVSGYFLIDAGSSMGWGLIGIAATSVLAVISQILPKKP